MIIKILILLLTFFSSDSLETKLKNYVAEKLPEVKRFELQIKTMTIKKDNIINVEIDKSREFKLSGKFAYIPIILEFSEGRKVQSILTSEIKIYGDVFVAIRDISKGEVINIKDFILDEQELRNQNMKPLIDFNSEYKAKVNIKKGDLLLSDKVDFKPIIKIGDKLTAHLIRGSVSISFQAESRSNGLVGDKINILSYDNKIYTALIKDNKNVYINE